MGRKKKDNSKNKALIEQYANYSRENLKEEVIRKMRLIGSLKKQLKEETKMTNEDIKRFEGEVEFLIAQLDINEHEDQVADLLSKAESEE